MILWLQDHIPELHAISVLFGTLSTTFLTRLARKRFVWRSGGLASSVLFSLQAGIITGCLNYIMLHAIHSVVRDQLQLVFPMLKDPFTFSLICGVVYGILPALAIPSGWRPREFFQIATFQLRLLWPGNWQDSARLVGEMIRTLMQTLSSKHWSERVIEYLSLFAMLFFGWFLNFFIFLTLLLDTALRLLARVLIWESDLLDNVLNRVAGGQPDVRPTLHAMFNSLVWNVIRPEILNHKVELALISAGSVALMGISLVILTDMCLLAVFEFGTPPDYLSDERSDLTVLEHRLYMFSELFFEFLGDFGNTASLLIYIFLGFLVWAQASQISQQAISYAIIQVVALASTIVLIGVRAYTDSMQKPALRRYFSILGSIGLGIQGLAWVPVLWQHLVHF